MDSQEARNAARQAQAQRRGHTHSPLLQDDVDGRPRTPTMDMAMQDAMLDRQGDRSPDQRAGGNRYSAGAANTASSRRPTSQASPPQSQSAFFSGPGPARADAPEDAGAKPSGNQRRRVHRHSRRQSESLDAALNAAEPGNSKHNGMPAAYHEAAAREVQIHPSQQLQQQQQQRMAQLAQQQAQQRGLARSSAADMDRVGSPSIATSVLKPLETKMREYHELMDDAERQLAQLDDELIALQERRRQAEERFADAKAKHDAYERQHTDVERALRGDFQSMHLGPQQHPQHSQPQFHQHQQQQQQQFGSRPSLSRPRAPSMDSYDDRPMSGHSTAPKARNRFRLSLFK